MRRVVCSVTFFYDPESYIFEGLDDGPPTDEEILRRCRIMFLDDIRDQEEPFPLSAIRAEFMENTDAG